MIEIHDRVELNAYLREHHIETILPESLHPHLSLFCFEKGERICSQGEPAANLYVLVKGKIKIYTTSPEGKTLILSFKTPLELIGDIEYVRKMDFLNTVEAVSAVMMIGVHHRWLTKYGSDYAPLLKFLLEIITQKFAIKSNSMSFNLLYPVEVRLASYLLSVCLDESDNQLVGQLPTSSLGDAANLIGTSYRHLNRIVQQLCTAGVIERKNGNIWIKNKWKLLELANHNLYK